MPMLELWCAICDLDSVCRFTIAQDATVLDLQEAIYRSQRYGERFQDHEAFPAAALRLFVARHTDGAWVTEEEVIEARAHGHVDTSSFVAMQSTWTLTDDACFGAVTLARGVIHVLVALPPLVANDDDDDDDASSDDELRTKRQYTHSQIGSSDGREIMEHLCVRMEEVTITTDHDETLAATERFDWKAVEDARSHPTQAATTDEATQQARVRYRAYFEAHLKHALHAERLCVIEVPTDLHVLTVGVRDMQFSGQPDLLILSARAKTDPSVVQWLTNVRMLVDVQRTMRPRNDVQGLTKLLALDLLTRHPVMALVTDLDKDWRFFWIAESGAASAVVHKASMDDPRDAFHLIRAWLTLESSRAVESDARVVAVVRGIQRHKLSHLTRQVGDPRAVCEAIERYNDIASVLGPDYDMALEVARHLVQTIPAYHFRQR